MTCREVCIIALLGAGVGLVRAEGPVPATPPAPGQFDNLIKNSPFGQAAAPGTQPGNDASALEFRSVVVDNGEQFFSLHETASRTSQWVGLKESGVPFFVESYDSEKGSIQVKYRNQVIPLTLKRSQVVVQAMPTPAVAAPPGIQGNAGAPIVAASPASADEAARMAQVAEEIRRRRALRSPPGQLPTSNVVGTPAINPPRPAVTPARP